MLNCSVNKHVEPIQMLYFRHNYYVSYVTSLYVVMCSASLMYMEAI